MLERGLAAVAVPGLWLQDLAAREDKAIVSVITARHPRALHPLHAVLLAATVPLFLGALLSDLAYSRSYHIQWSNFASWLIAGGLVFCGLALVWAAVELLRKDRQTRPVRFALVLLATFVLGFFSALVHARDAWASMPEGLILSVIVAILALAATWIGFSSFRTGELK